MGKSDSFSKDLLQNNNYFADTINNILFNGVKIINPNDLQELDSTEVAIIDELVDRHVPIQKRRDILKQAIIRSTNSAIYAMFGIENQTSIHYAMPVRNLLYDAIRYARQVANKTDNYKKIGALQNSNNKLTRSEFLSGWSKEDKIVPIITVTVYFGADEWDGPVCIHDMLDKSIPSYVLDQVPDYNIHLLEPTKITRWNTYQTDIGLLYKTIAVSNSNCGIENYIKDQSEDFRHVDNKIAHAINFYTKANILIDNETEEVDMCYAIKTAEACHIIKTCVDFNHTLQETVTYVLNKFIDDGDITEAYITEQYNAFLQGQKH